MKIPVIAAVVLLGLTLITVCSCSPPVPKTALIKIEKIDATEEWRPSTVEIAAGGIVTWTNNSYVVVHYVISGEGLFNEKLGGGESFTFTFPRSGTFTYYDDPTISAGVVGTIYVK